MIVKAKVDFGGQYAMYKGTAADLPDNPVTRALIASGFIEEAPEELTGTDLAGPEAQESEEPDDERPQINLKALRKEDLLRICEEKGIEAGKKATKEELIAAIEAEE